MKLQREGPTLTLAMLLRLGMGSSSVWKLCSDWNSMTECSKFIQTPLTHDINFNLQSCMLLNQVWSNFLSLILPSALLLLPTPYSSSLHSLLDFNTISQVLRSTSGNDIHYEYHCYPHPQCANPTYHVALLYPCADNLKLAVAMSEWGHTILRHICIQKQPRYALSIVTAYLDIFYKEAFKLI